MYVQQDDGAAKEKVLLIVAPNENRPSAVPSIALEQVNPNTYMALYF